MKRRPGISLADLVGGPDDADGAPTPGADVVAQAGAPTKAATSIAITALDDEAPEVPEIVPLTFHISPRDRVRLKVLCAESGLSLQKIGHAAFTMFLNARGLPGLDPRDASVPDGRKGKRKRR